MRNKRRELDFDWKYSLSIFWSRKLVWFDPTYLDGMTVTGSGFKDNKFMCNLVC